MLLDDKTPVNSLLPCDNNQILAACGSAIFELSTDGNLRVLVSIH